MCSIAWRNTPCAQYASACMLVTCSFAMCSIIQHFYKDTTSVSILRKWSELRQAPLVHWNHMSNMHTQYEGVLYLVTALFACAYLEYSAEFVKAEQNANIVQQNATLV